MNFFYSYKKIKSLNGISNQENNSNVIWAINPYTSGHDVLYLITY